MPRNTFYLMNECRGRIIFRLLPVFFLTLLVFISGGCHREGNGSSTVKIAGIVLKWIAEDREANFQRAAALIREAAAGGAKIICTTESFLDGYSMRLPEVSLEKLRSLAEPVPDGPYYTRLRQLCDELNIYLVAGLTELDNDKMYNSAGVIGPDGRHLGTYRKKFLWTTEEGTYTPGGGFPVIETTFGKIGMMICSDRRHPESIRELADNGAELVFCLAGGGYGEENDRVVSQRAKEGHVPIVFVHPIEFSVTGASGDVLTSSLFGNQLDENPEEPQGGVVGFYDFPLTGQHVENK